MHRTSNFDSHTISISSQVTAVPKVQEVQKVEPAVRQPEAAKQPASTPAASPLPAAPPQKVDYATDLFNMLSMDGPNENGSETASTDDNSWAGFQCMCVFPYFWAVFKCWLMQA